MSAVTASVLSVQIGAVAPLGPQAVPSGFRKRPRSGPVRIARLGLEGDEQADHRVHGGPDKAVYAYAAAHYPRWRLDHPVHAQRLVPGAFGENLTVTGIEEGDLHAGDVHRVGTALLQVCQPRQPCFKLALHFEDGQMPRAMVRNGRAGWYYRVLEQGQLQAGDSVCLMDRPNPGLPFTRLIDIIYRRQASREDWRLLSTAAGVAESVRQQAQRMLAGGSRD